MAFQAVPNTAAIIMVFTLNGEPAQNVFYAEIPGGYVLADLIALAVQIDANWQGNWRTEQPLEVSYVRTEIRGLAVENDLTTSNNASANPGSNASPSLPNNVTFSVKKESGLTGRSARGRTYWIGIPTSQLDSPDENRLKQLYVDDVVANVDTVRTSIIAVASWTPVLVSRFANGAQRAVGVTFPWISTTFVDTIVDTQRGRLPK